MVATGASSSFALATPACKRKRSSGGQSAKAKRAVDGEIAIKRNRYFDLSTPNKKVNYALAAITILRCAVIEFCFLA